MLLTYASLLTAPLLCDTVRNKMAEQQLRARQLVLQQQADSAIAAASKTQREVYIGNLGGTQITAEALRDMFNSTMTAAFGDKVRVIIHCDAGFDLHRILCLTQLSLLSS